MQERRRPKLNLQTLEERALPSWAGTPPALIAPPDNAVKVGITSKKDVRFGNAAITKNEVDFFRLTAPVTGTYTFEATTPKSDMDTVLGVFDTAGNRLAFNNNISGNDTDSRLTFPLTAGQTVFMGITNHLDTPGGKYRWQVTSPGVDDKYEENDTIGKAKNLGTIKGSKTLSGLKMMDQADFFKFSFKGKADPSSQVRLNFNHSLGDVDVRLFDRLGNLIRVSQGVTNQEVISLDGFLGSTYYIQVYGFDGATNPDYSLTVDLTTTPIATAARTLYLNFDGANISRSTLERISAGWSDPSMADYFDADKNGITIQPLLQNRGDREQIISLMLYHLNQDLKPFGITAKRHFGGPVEGKNTTTIFLGQSSLTGGYHIACDIDVGNNNPTDIAFVGNEDWGSAADTALALADVTLHEAGHTWGLWHVSSGTDLETMGLRYNNPQSQWLKNTSFLNVTYTQYQNHGPGPINTFQTMHTNFGWGFASPAAARVSVDTSSPGMFAISAAHKNDVIEIEPIDSGRVEVRINGMVHRIADGLEEIRIFTDGNDRVNVKVLGDLGDVAVEIDPSAGTFVPSTKLDDISSEFWKTGVPHREGFGGCGCPNCMNAVMRFVPIPAGESD